MSTLRLEDAIEELRKKLTEYKIGDKYGLSSFTDADPGEMEKFGVRIGVFGPTGSGKSALISTIAKILRSAEDGDVAISQSAGGEGTRVLEEFMFGGFSMYDTRGFFTIDSALEETEFFRILYGSLRPGEEIDRGDMGQQKTKSAGIAAYKLNKPPLSRQLHVALWVIKGDDVRLINEDYQDRLDFVLSKLRDEAISMVTVITHGDVLDKEPNPSEARKEAKAKAREATKSNDYNTFVIHNWTENISTLDDSTTKDILTMIDRALECGERSVKIRQTQRKQHQLKAAKQAQCHGGSGPTETDETTDIRDKNYIYKYNNLSE